MQMQKLYYLKNENSFLDETKKTFFIVFEGLLFLLKNKNLMENSRHKL